VDIVKQTESTVATAANTLQTLEPFEAINPEQEHYLGRAVGANILLAYPAVDAEQANDYVNTLGQALAMASQRPDTHGGYRFALTNSDEPHAFAAPGGFIFISKGMFKLAGSEAGLAAVLAHEIAHVQHRHAVKAIKTSRITESLTKPISGGLSDEERAALQKSFIGSVGDVIGSLVDAGYSKKAEYQADSSSIQILKAVGYDPGALGDVLSKLKKQETTQPPNEGTENSSNNHGALGDVLTKFKKQETTQQANEGTEKKNKFLANHPPATERITRLTEAGISISIEATSEARQARYDAALASLNASVE